MTKDAQIADLIRQLVDAKNEIITLKQTIHLYLPVQDWPDTEPITWVTA